MGKDYYRILEIESGTDAEGIRAAYLRMAKNHHPDRAGQHETALFQEIREAYDVLSDPEKKKRYDSDCHARAKHRISSRSAAVRPEPLIPVPSNPRLRRSSFQEIYETILSHPLWEDAPAEEFNVGVHLTEVEASRGCLLHFEVAVPRICRVCAGSGRVWPGRCRSCRGTGRIYENQRLRLRVPRGTEDRTVVEMPLFNGSGSGSLLRFHIRIGSPRL